MKLKQNIKLIVKPSVYFECLKCNLVWLPRKSAENEQIYRCARCKALSSITEADKLRVKREIEQISNKTEQVAKSNEKERAILEQKGGLNAQNRVKNTTLL